MNSYRPIVDTWLLARPKVAYYGSYPSGFLERARALLGVGADEPVLHVCAGKVRDYPFRGFGPNDCTLDLDKELKPDFCLDAGKIGTNVGDVLPFLHHGNRGASAVTQAMTIPHSFLWPALLVDPPYSPDDAEHYRPGRDSYVPRSELLRRSLQLVQPGRRVGFLDFCAPRPPKHGVRLVALISVYVGYGNAVRCFSVFERETDRAPVERARAMAAIRGRRVGKLQRGSRKVAAR